MLQKFGREPIEVIASGCGRQVIYTRPTIGRTVAATWVVGSVSPR